MLRSNQYSLYKRIYIKLYILTFTILSTATLYGSLPVYSRITLGKVTSCCEIHFFIFLLENKAHAMNWAGFVRASEVVGSHALRLPEGVAEFWSS